MMVRRLIVAMLLVMVALVVSSCGGKVSDGPWEVDRERCGGRSAQPFLAEVMREPVLADGFDVREYELITAYMHQEYAGWTAPGLCEYFSVRATEPKEIYSMMIIRFFDERSAQSFAVEFTDRREFPLNEVELTSSGARVFGQHLCVFGFVGGNEREVVETVFDEVHVDFAERHCE